MNKVIIAVLALVLSVANVSFASDVTGGETFQRSEVLEQFEADMLMAIAALDDAECSTDCKAELEIHLYLSLAEEYLGQS